MSIQHLKLKPFQKTQRIFWLALILAIIGIIFYGYLYSIVGAVAKNIASLQADTDALVAQESKVDELKKNLAANQAREPVLVSYFIDANDIVPFLETIEGYGKSTNVIVKFDTVSINQSPDELAVSLKGDGTFADLYRFISLLEAAPYEFSIKAADVQSVLPIGLTPVGKGVHSTGWEAHISLAVVSISGVPKPAAPAK